MSSDSENEVDIVFSDDEDIPTQIRTEELEVKCLDLHNQILHRPDTYVGSTKKIKYLDQVWVVKDSRFIQSKPTYSEGLLRIFVEIVSNAIDNVWRSKEFGISCKSIKIEIDNSSGKTSVWNDGKPIPLDIHKEQNKYIPELIFSRLLTSTNYNDDEKRKTSGRNGYGSKLTNIFSKEFNIEVYNPKEKKIYKQSWNDNMFKRFDPKIEDYSKSVPDLTKGSGYTKVSWIPDFKRFDKMNGYDNDIISLYEKYIYDTAMIVSKYGVKVYLNDKLVPICSLRDYALLYRPESERDTEEIHLFSSPDSKVVVMPFNRHVSVSFVNGICTTEGGVHDDAWTEAIFRPIVDKINKVKKPVQKTKTKAEKEKEKKKKEKEKKSNTKIDIDDVYKHFAIFIDCELDNPEFRGQNKTKLASPNVEVKIKKTDIPKIMKWGVIEDIKRMIEIRDLSELKVKTRGFTKVEGLDDANFARKPGKRQDCILCITEGLSAKTYVIDGIGIGLTSRTGKRVSGRDYIGILPIRGKFINPRGRSMKTVAKNAEVKAIVQTLGLQVNTDYTDEENLKTLRYGRVVVFADADKDGIHIVGLLYNFIQCLYPTLLQVPGFFCFARTPIMKISGQPFYYLSNAQKYIVENNIGKNRIKYYKGLGTSNKSDIKADFGKRIVSLVYEDDTDEVINNIFDKKKSSFRKEWLTSFDESKVVTFEAEDGEEEELPLSNFINDEFITFSIEDCKRSLPNIYDGLKESQRKILYAVFQRKLKYSGKSLKVAQLCGYVAEKTNYHHGEDNLIDTIRSMAQRFVGSNNMPYFYNDGQFGSRVQNGKDGASGRYIFTKQESYIRYVYPEADDDYLENAEDDGDIVEKKHYVPAIPMILVNGCIGIGTGFSTSIPAYNPLTLIEWIRVWMKTDGKVFEDLGNGIILSDGPELIPWYRGFKGKIEVSGSKVLTYGILEDCGKGKYRVTELPIGKKNWSIDKFKCKLEELLEKKAIKDFSNHSNDTIINFTITEDPDGMAITMENLGLIDTIHTSNMVLFVDENKIKKYSTVEEILHDFCVKKFELCEIRRRGEIDKLEEEIKYLSNKIRFITEVNLPDSDKNKLVIKDREDEDLYMEMDEKKYNRRVDKKKKANNKEEEDKTEENEETEEDSDDEEDEKNEGSYNYLLNLKMRGAMKSKMDTLLKERQKLETELSLLKSKTPKDLWEEDLVLIEKKYKEWLPYADESKGDVDSGKKKKKTIKK